MTPIGRPHIACDVAAHRDEEQTGYDGDGTEPGENGRKVFDDGCVEEGDEGGEGCDGRSDHCRRTDPHAQQIGGDTDAEADAGAGAEHEILPRRVAADEEGERDDGRSGSEARSGR